MPENTPTPTTPARRRWGRACTVCTHLDREAVELALLDGDLLSRLSREYELSDDALRRHRDRHMQVPGDTPTGLSPQTIAQRVLRVAERNRELAEDAAREGRTVAAARAGDAELRALSALASMGAAEAPLRQLDQYTALVRAAVVASRRDPLVKRALAVALRDTDRPTLATEVAELEGFPAPAAPPTLEAQ